MVVPATRITVSVPQPATHLLHVEVATPDLPAGKHEFFMPVWTPGSYLVREYSRHVEAVEARNYASTGQAYQGERDAGAVVETFGAGTRRGG